MQAAPRITRNRWAEASILVSCFGWVLNAIAWRAESGWVFWLAFDTVVAGLVAAVLGVAERRDGGGRIVWLALALGLVGPVLYALGVLWLYLALRSLQFDF